MFKSPFFTVKLVKDLKNAEGLRLLDALTIFYNHVPFEFLQKLLIPFSKVVPKKKLSYVIVSIDSSDVIVFFANTEPIFFSCFNHIFPTVYSLWKYPQMLRCIEVHENVYSMSGGKTDVTLSSLSPKETLNSYLTCAGVSLQTTNAEAPFAIGRVLRKTDERGNEKEKVIQLLHCCGDYLWQMGSKIMDLRIFKGPEGSSRFEYQKFRAIINAATEEDIKKHLAESSNTGGSESASGAGGNRSASGAGGSRSASGAVGSRFDSGAGGGTSGSAAGGGKFARGGKSGSGAHVDKSGHGGSASLEEDAEKTKISASVSMGEQIKECFLYGLKRNKEKNTELFMHADTFYQNYVVAYFPPNNNLEVEKSSYESIMGFLNCMQRCNLLEIEDEVNVTSINPNHNDVKKFQIPDWEPLTAEDEKKRVEYVPPYFKPFYKVTRTVLPFLQQFEPVQLGDMIVETQVQLIFMNYVVDFELKIGRFLHRNDDLSRIVFRGNSCVFNLPFDQAVKSFLQEMEKMYCPGSLMIVIVKPSKKATRSVTLVKNLEPFGFRLKDLVLDFSTNLSCQSSIITDQQGNQILLVQGNQSAIIKNRLTGVYKIELSWIDDCQYHDL